VKEDNKKASKFRSNIDRKILKASGPITKEDEKKNQNEILAKKFRLKMGRGGQFLNDENDENWSIDS
jgi:hypothetical protein